MTSEPFDVETLADRLRALGDVPTNRVLWLGRMATEPDVLRVKATELVDGLLVRKGLSYPKGLAEVVLGCRLGEHVRPRALGGVTLGSGPYRVAPGIVRRPDLAFARWDRVLTPAGDIPDIVPAAPDLVAEFPTTENTAAELKRKRWELLAGGCRLLWVIELKARTVDVFTDPDTHTTLTATDTLTGGDVLPGFALPLAELFDDPQLNPRP